MIKHIIVQAGGRGSRLETLTANKPKALVPVDNLPMLFHLFNRYPNAEFTIIADYKKEVLKRYLSVYANVKYKVIDADKKGTCSGIQDALNSIPENTPFMIVWCDLVLSEIKSNVVICKNNYLGISKDFICRWSYKDDKFVESPSSENGVAGLFIFKDKNQISDVPRDGEFVRYLSNKNLKFERLDMYGGLEIGTMLSYFQNELNKPKCRPFNKMEFKENKVFKYPLNGQGIKLAADEIAWYKKVIELGFRNIPKIESFSPLVMEKIDGANIYDYGFLTKGFKRALLEKIIEVLQAVHNSAPPRGSCCG